MFSFMNPGKSKPAKKGLKIIIVGCGKVGTTLVEQLSKEGHDIIIIDKNAKKVQEIANIYDIMGIVGNGASYSVQMDAGIEDTDLIISVTESDELNLLCCTVAKQVGDCAAIARVRTPDYSTVFCSQINLPFCPLSRYSTVTCFSPLQKRPNNFAEASTIR